MKEVTIIGAGFSGLSSALFLARKGYRVKVLEKNDQAGGRARILEPDGFTFDMGPSWYWMPDVFDRFFQSFGHKPEDFYDLVRLDPGYRMFFRDGETLDVPANIRQLYALFESLEKGSSARLEKFLDSAAYKYDIGINKMVYLPGRSPAELLRTDLLSGALRLDVLKSLAASAAKVVRNKKLRQMLEFPVLFLGATAKDTPALYSLMNYADLVLGTWYPMGGMYRIVEGMLEIAKSLGVEVIAGSPVTSIGLKGSGIVEVRSTSDSYRPDLVVGAADYHFIEQVLLPPACRKYTEEYWDRRKMAPSALLFYLGIDREVPGLMHHNLFFDEDYMKHAAEIYDYPAWPEKPAIYVSCTSKTDPSVAPRGMENLTVLIPVAPGLEDLEETRGRYYEYVMDKLERHTGTSLRDHVIFKRSYAHNNFISDYNSYKGNAYGLANTLRQTAFLKPSMHSKKVRNLFYAGQLTVPGPGVPPALISGEVVAGEIDKQYNPS